MTEEQETPDTPEEKQAKAWMHWQMIREVIEFKRERMRRVEGVPWDRVTPVNPPSYYAKRMEHWTGIQANFCMLLLQDLSKQSVEDLRLMRPKLGKLPPVVWLRKDGKPERRKGGK